MEIILHLVLDLVFLDTINVEWLSFILSFCCRTPKDFASASDKIWGHFAAEDIERTPKADLVGMGIMKQVTYSL